MLELIASSLLMLSPAAQPSQVFPPRWRVEDVRWTQTLAASGRPVLVAEFSRAGVENIVEHGNLIALEEQLLRARAAHDRDVIARILSDDYVGTDATGRRGTKTETVAQWTSSRPSVIPTTAQIRSSGNIAIITGEQLHTDSSGTAAILFTRVYVRGLAGWHVVSNAEVHPRDR
jgi:hypothetical protein